MTGTIRLDYSSELIRSINVFTLQVLLLFTWPFWFNTTLPIVHVLPFDVPYTLLCPCLILISVCLIIFVFRQKRTAIWIALALLIIACLLNVNIIQPYLFQLAVLIILSSINSQSSYVASSRMVFSIMYLFSGIHKLNVHYEDYVVTFLANDTESKLISLTLYLIPFIEIVGGIFLFVRPVRKLTHVAFIFMHIATLMFLVVTNYNPVIWVWNIFLAFHHIWFLKQKTPISQWNSLSVIVVGFISFLSIGSLFNTNLSYLGWNLYSGRISYGYIHAERKADLPEHLRRYAVQADNYFSVNLLVYSVEKYGISVNPLPVIYAEWFRQLSNSEPESSFLGQIRINSFNTSKSLYFYQYKKMN